ncbi:S8 family serine peptidase [Paenibacillus sp. 1011MAR3C5]|uniref:S8 family serine peptidase n=1 Tax=Paenibacillus sp. 1011MAR3C5 TaxID=1675787 RepID=UPI0015FEFF76|nr:S8 family serine peptidase [Paenibacillus sp. 1011MAR3C5]
MLSRKIVSLVLSAILVLSLAVGFTPAHAADGQSASMGKAVQQPPGEIVIKFKEEAKLPYQDGAEKALKATKNAAHAGISADLNGLELNRLFSSLNAKTQLSSSSQTSVFHQYFTAAIPKGTDVKALLAKLNKSPLVEAAYEAPTNISDPSPPYAPNSTPVQPGDDPLYPNQAYGQAAPLGIDAPYAWQYEGGDGKGISYVDIEQGWALNHEDLTAHGVEALPSILMPTSAAHGTAVLGVISAVDNTIGHVGLANKAKPLVNSWRRIDGSSNIAEAIVTSVPALNRGDVILIEVQSTSSTSNGQYVPMEVFPAEFDAIRYATDQGIVVVEAGANGSVNLDTYQDWNGKYILNTTSPDFKDSGAILVGAASSSVPHDRMYFSSYGSRIDSFGFGHNVHTLSAIDLNSTTGYTTSFSGTSSASPIVTAAVISLQGIAKAKYGSTFSPHEVRELLRNPAYNTASANPAVDQIGHLPNLKYMIDHMTAPSAVSDTEAPSVPVQLAAANVTSSSAELSWSASTDNVGVIGYDIYQDGVKVGVSAGTSYTVNGLSASTSYSFSVKAKDAAGHVSAASAALAVTTSAPPLQGQTFELTVPANTPVNADIYMYVHGLNNSWSVNDPAYQLTRNSNGTYSITLNVPIGTTFHYNFSRGTWGSMETLSGGGYVGPRAHSVTSGTQLTQVTVARWGDL